MKTIPVRELRQGMIVRPVNSENEAFVDRIVRIARHNTDGTGVVSFSRPHATVRFFGGYTSAGYSRCEEWDEPYGEWHATRQLYRVVGQMDTRANP